MTCYRCNDTGIISTFDETEIEFDNYPCPNCQGIRIDAVSDICFVEKFMATIISHGLMKMADDNLIDKNLVINYLKNSQYDYDAKIIVECLNKIKTIVESCWQAED